MNKLLREQVVELQWLGTLRAYRLLAKTAGDNQMLNDLNVQIAWQENLLSKIGLMEEDGYLDKHCQKVIHRAFVLTMIWKTNFKNEEIDYV